MKRIDLIRHLERHHSQFLREGANYSVNVNRVTGKVPTALRHREINEHLACKIYKDLEITPRQGRRESLTQSIGL